MWCSRRSSALRQTSSPTRSTSSFGTKLKRRSSTENRSTLPHCHQFGTTSTSSISAYGRRTTEKLKIFKNEALLIFSGGVTHNLSEMGYGNTKNYAKEFNDTIKNIIENANVEELKNISKDKNFYKNHPTTEHFIPLLLAFGSAFNKKGESFNSEILYSNISLESFIFDKKEA